MNDKDKLDIVHALQYFSEESRGFTNDCAMRCGELIRKVFDLSSEDNQMKQVLFRETEPESLWSIFVDGKLIEAALRPDEMDLRDMSL